MKTPAEIKERNKNRQRTIKEKLIKLYGEKCHLCEGSFHQSVYDFHHINSQNKVAQLSKFKSFKSSKEEAKKCIMLCSNCHRTIHAKLDYILEDIRNDS